jgi:hypothetical protein
MPVTENTNVLSASPELDRALFAPDGCAQHGLPELPTREPLIVEKGPCLKSGCFQNT